MKIRQMIEVCKSHHGQCNGCELNCVYDWQENLTTWCLMDLKALYVDAYNEYRAEHNDKMCEMIMKKYDNLERKYLKL